ncbi:MAG: hypothetical protein UMR38_04810 [Candidatus Izemoplasma sp.]|nr:hypothetical protein [Candidatus Izemoplasma sp.]
MLEQVIDKTHDQLLKKELDGHYVWQEIYHALMGSYFWFRLKKKPFKQPYNQAIYFPELEEKAKKNLDKADINHFLIDVKRRVSNFLIMIACSYMKKPSL